MHHDGSSNRYRVVLAVSVVALVLVDTHPLWRPWTGGLVTEAFARTVWAANVALVVQILANAALLWAPAIRGWAAPLTAVLLVGGGLLSLGVFASVYPLDLAAVGVGEWRAAVRFLLGVAFVALMVAFVVTLLRSVGPVLGRSAPPPPPDEAPAEKKRRPTRQSPPPKRSGRR